MNISLVTVTLRNSLMPPKHAAKRALYPNKVYPEKDAFGIIGLDTITTVKGR